MHLYTQVLIDKVLQILEEVLALQPQIKQEPQQVVVKVFLINQVEEELVTNV